MPVHAQNPHGTTAYAPPVTCRAPSPASSIGTQYDDDATSDSELNMSELAFERMCEEKIRLWEPRPEEEVAEKEPLIQNKPPSNSAAEKAELCEKILGDLRAEIKRLDEEEIYERTMLKGSTIGLEAQAPTTDIDKIMRSLMSSSRTLNCQPPPPDPPTGEQALAQPEAADPPGVELAPGPWSNYGNKPSPNLPPRCLTRALRIPSAPTMSPPRSCVTSFMTTATATSETPAEDQVATEALVKFQTTTTVGGKPIMPPIKEADSSHTATTVGSKRTRSGVPRW